jgi:hypothetical protein
VGVGVIVGVGQATANVKTALVNSVPVWTVLTIVAYPLNWSDVTL